MADQRSRYDQDDSEDLLMNEDVEFFEDDNEDDEQEQSALGIGRSANLSMRHRIEEKLEERRLMKELNEYEFFDLEEDVLH